MDAATFRPERYREARERMGFNHKEVAERLKVAVNLPGMWERSEREPSLNRLVALARLLHVTTDWLLGLDEAPEREAVESAAPRSRVAVTQDPGTPAGLRALAEDADLCAGLRIEPEEWEALAGLAFRGGLSKLGQVALLALLRDTSMESRRALVQRKGGRPLKDSTLAAPPIEDAG